MTSISGLPASNLQQFLDTAGVGLVRNSADLRYLVVNAAYAQLVGRPIEHIVGRSLGEVLGEKGLATVLPHVERVLRGERVEYEAELPISPARRRWIHVVYTPERDSSGRVIGWVGAITDITENRRTAQRLEESERHFRFVTDHVPALIVHCDREARYRLANRPYTQRFGLEPENVVGKRIADVIGEAAYEKLRPHVERVLRGERVDYEELLPYAYGERWMNFRYEPQLEPDGTVGGFVAVIQDITARKQLQDKLREEERRKDEFLAILAHELRNPLAPLRTGLELLEHAPAHERAADVRAMMGRQLTHMVRLIDDLLDMSRISRGKIQLQMERIDAADALGQGLEASRPVVQARGHELSVKLPSEPVFVNADPTRVAQIVANLVNNAAKFTAPGGRIGVVLKRDGADASISVTDTGQGLAPDMLERVFDMFIQAGDGQRADGGLGIGLAIVKGLAALHGGTVSAHSAGQGKGAEFVVRLPASDEGPRPRVALHPVTEFGARRVLIADDNTDAAAALASMIALTGSETRLANDGEEAVAAVRDFRPDVILLDLGMPRMDGYEACRAIRSFPEGRQAVIVALTGWGQEHDRRKSEQAGFDAHLLKPAEFAQITEAIQRVRARGSA